MARECRTLRALGTLGRSIGIRPEITSIEFYVVRTRPSDRQKVIATAQEADAIDSDWNLQRALGSARHPEDLEREIQQLGSHAEPYEKPHLQAMLARSRQQYDRAWTYYNIARDEAATELQMGIRRNLTFEMAGQLVAEGKLREALATLVEVSFYDVNGCNNAGISIEDDGRRIPFGKPWTREDKLLAPGIVELTRDLVKRVGITQDGFTQLVAAHLQPVADQLRTPFSVGDAMPVLLEVSFGSQSADHIKIPSPKRREKRPTDGPTPRSQVVPVADMQKADVSPKSGCLVSMIAVILIVMAIAAMLV
jgi:hypothetical protein